MAPRNIQFAVTSGTTTVMVTGQIDAADIVTGRMTLIDGTGGNAPVAVSITGSVSGGAIEGLVFASLDTGTIDLAGSGTIDGNGVVSVNVTGTVGGNPFAAVAVGAANDRLVHHGTAQHEADAAGAFALGVPVSDPCAILAKLRQAKIELVSGAAISRVTAPGGRDVTFQKGDLTELTKLIAEYQAACNAASGTTPTVSETPRTRRAIRFNPYA